MKLALTISLCFILNTISIRLYAQKINEVNHLSMDTMRWEKMSDKVYRKYAYGSNGLIAYLRLEKGAFIPMHNHPNEQITHILEGKVEVVIREKKYIVSKGEVIIIPPNVPHQFTALETTLDLDVFSPIRLDWINNTANYFTNQNSPELIEVAKLNFRPGNVTISENGELFSTVHPLDNTSMQLIKITGQNNYTVFPNESWQRNSNESATPTKFDTPLGINTDSKNNLWVIDIGLNYGKTRLFAFDRTSRKKTFEYVLPSNIAPKGSFIQDLAVDDKNGFVYLADIENPGIIVVNIKKKTCRRIGNHQAFLAENVDMIINKKIIYFKGQKARIAINPITISHDKETVFFGAMNGKTWYSISAKALRSNLTEQEIINTIEKVGEKPISDGAATDAMNNHYFTNLNDNGIDFWKNDTKTLEPIIRDNRLDWTDNLAIGKDGYLYFTVNQLYKTPAFSGDTDSGKAPYYIYKIQINK